jgi:hypothetical protein
MNDRYIKAVLTVIAVALCWIAGQLTMTNASAASAPPTPAPAFGLPTMTLNAIESGGLNKNTPLGLVYCVPGYRPTF